MGNGSLSETIPCVVKSLRERLLRIASAVLMSSGLVMLGVFFLSGNDAAVQVSDITSGMNMRYVHVGGKVADVSSTLPRGDFRFSVNDGSGVIPVVAGRSLANELKVDGLLPSQGDMIALAGCVFIDRDFPMLRLQSVNQISRKENCGQAGGSTVLGLTEISADQNGLTVSVRGTLQSIEIPAPGSRAPFLLLLEDQGCELPVVFWKEAFHDPDGILPVPGDQLVVKGQVDLYRGSLQIKVDDFTTVQAVSGR